MELMGRTVFTTPVVKTMFRGVARLLLWIGGWKVEGKKPDVDKCVMIAAPHTSNWDFYYAIAMAFVLDLEIYALGKKELVENRFGKIMLFLGLVPVDRAKSNNLVGQAVAAFNEREKMILVVPPSGTRSRVEKWKTGFYHIAHGAGVPICLTWLDYARKRGGIGPLFTPTGRVDRDMAEIQSFYVGITGKYPEKSLKG